MRASDIYLFVVWNRGLGELDKVLGALKDGFTVLKMFEVTWRPKDFIKNFSAFYGWKAWSMWWGKKRRAGTGSFRVIMVRDLSPKFGAMSDEAKARAREQKGEVEAEVAENVNVYGLKARLRELMSHSNVVHASVNEAETRHNLMAITGESLEAFAARTDLDGGVEEIQVERPLEFRPYKYLESRGKGPQYFECVFKFNRVNLFLLPRCGVPTIFSCSFRLLSLFNFAFCLGTIKMGYKSR